jgi:hypothetical protein
VLTDCTEFFLKPFRAFREKTSLRTRTENRQENRTGHFLHQGYLRVRFVKTKNHTPMTLTEEDIIAIKNAFQPQFVQINYRFEKMDERFVKMDERFVRMEDRFVKMEHRFVKMEDRLEKVEQGIIELTHKVNLRLTGIELRLDSIEFRIGRIEVFVPVENAYIIPPIKKQSS